MTIGEFNKVGAYNDNCGDIYDALRALVVELEQEQELLNDSALNEMAHLLRSAAQLVESCAHQERIPDRQSIKRATFTTRHWYCISEEALAEIEELLKQAMQCMRGLPRSTSELERIIEFRQMLRRVITRRAAQNILIKLPNAKIMRYACGLREKIASILNLIDETWAAFNSETIGGTGQVDDS